MTFTRTHLAQALSAGFLATLCWAAEPVQAIRGSVTKVDNATKTVMVKTADGTVHTFRVAPSATVHGVKTGATDTFTGLKEGSEVAVHYTGEGSAKVAVEVDRLSAPEVKVVEGTVSGIDRGAKTIAVKSADGTEHAFKLSDHAAEGTAKDVGKGTKVAVYYVADGGKDVAHFFERK